MKGILLVLSCLLFIGSPVLAHQDSLHTSKETRLRRIVARIQKQEFLMMNYQITPRNRGYAKTLAKIATDADLIELAKQENKTVFCLAYLILSKRGHSMAVQIYNQYKNMDEQTFISQTRTITDYNRKHKFDVIRLYSNSDFVYDVFVYKKYLNVLD